MSVNQISFLFTYQNERLTNIKPDQDDICIIISIF